MSLTHDFECRLFDSPRHLIYDDGDSFGHSSYGYEPFPMLIMSRQQGFVFNEEVLVSPVWRRSGYETFASMSKTYSSSGSDDLPGSISSQDEFDGAVSDDKDEGDHRTAWSVGALSETEKEKVIEIKFRATECDILPE